MRSVAIAMSDAGLASISRLAPIPRMRRDRLPITTTNAAVVSRFGSGPDWHLPDRVDEEIHEWEGERALVIRARVVATDRHPAHVRDGEYLSQNVRERVHRRSADGSERHRGKLAWIDDVDVDVHPDRAPPRPRDEARRLGMLSIEGDPQDA